MEKVHRRIINAGTWAASSDLAAIDLPREGLITEIGIRANITATLTATAVADCTKRVIQNLKIQGDGGRAFLGLSGEQAARLLNFLNECEFGCPLLHGPTDVGVTSFQQSFIFHPGSNPKDPFDLSAVIPARALSTLQILLTTTAAAVTDAAGNITAGTYNYWINEVLEAPVPRGIMTPLGSTLVWAHDANYSDFSKDIDLPGGAWLRRIIMLVQDETANAPVRKDDQITAVKLKLPRTASAQIEARWQDLKALTAKRYGLPQWEQEGVLGAIATTRPGYDGQAILPAGLAILDLRDYFDPVYGANLTRFQTGDVKLGLTVENYTAGDDTLIYWDQLQPVEDIYVGK
jgi:hypothetical protein